MKKIIIGAVFLFSLVILPSTASANIFTDFFNALFGISAKSVPIVSMITQTKATTSLVDNGTSRPKQATIGFTFTFNNTEKYDLYFAKDPNVAFAMTSTVGVTASSTLIQSLTIASPGTLAGDTSTFWTIPAGTSRIFTYTGLLDNTNGQSAYHSTSITKIYYSSDLTNFRELSVSTGLDELRTPAVNIGVGQSSFQSSTKALITDVTGYPPAKAVLVDNGTQKPKSANIGFNFTFNNISNTDLYIAKNPDTSLSTFTTEGSVSTLTQNLTAASPGTRSGDSTTFWVIPASTQRSFFYVGLLSSRGAGANHSTSIKKIYFTDDSTNLKKFVIESGLERFATPVVNIEDVSFLTNPPVSLDRPTISSVTSKGNKDYQFYPGDDVTLTGAYIASNGIVKIGSTNIQLYGDSIPDKSLTFRVPPTIKPGTYSLYVDGPVLVTNKVRVTVLAKPSTSPAPINSLITLSSRNIGLVGDGGIGKSYQVDLSFSGSTATKPVSQWALTLNCPSQVDANTSPGTSCNSTFEMGTSNNGNVSNKAFWFKNYSESTQTITAILKGYDSFNNLIGSSQINIQVPPTSTGTQTWSQVNVISPNGLESYAVGQSIKIQWKTTDGSFRFLPSSRTQIYLLQDRAVVATLDYQPNSGIANFPIPSNIKPGSNYKISVTIYAEDAIFGTAMQDESDRTFTITSPTSSPVPAPVVVVCPAGYTCYPQGNFPICPAGYTCTPVTQNCPIGYKCYTQAVTQNSQPYINILSPNGGELYSQGQTVPISFSTNLTAQQASSGFNIIMYYGGNSTNAGMFSSGVQIIASRYTGGSPYKWSIPSSLASGNYLVYIVPDQVSGGIVTTKDSRLFDFGDNYFTITSPNATPVPTSSPLPQASASIDQSSLTSSSGMPTLSGYAYNVVQPFGISIGNSGGKVWASGNISPSYNRWSTTVNQNLSAGTYQVQVYSNNILLSSGTLTITSPNPSTYTAPTTTSSPTYTSTPTPTYSSSPSTTSSPSSYYYPSTSSSASPSGSGVSQETSGYKSTLASVFYSIGDFLDSIVSN